MSPMDALRHTLEEDKYLFKPVPLMRPGWHLVDLGEGAVKRGGSSTLNTNQ